MASKACKVDFSLPPPISECEFCAKDGDDSEDDDVTFFRCSKCKNRFYCSVACQLKDWNKHKYDCSVLPPEGLTHATITCDEEMQSEVDRITSLLEQWKAELPEDKTESLRPKFIVGARLPAAKAILDLEIPERFRYSRLPPDHKKFPYRVPLMLITRLFLMHLVATLSDEMLGQFRDHLGACKISLPSSMTQIFVPKILSRPADLSPGEYDMLARLFPAMMMTANEAGFKCDGENKWFILGIANAYLYNAPKKSEVEKASSS